MKKYVFERNKHVEDKLNEESYPLGGISIDDANVVMFIYDKRIKKTTIRHPYIKNPAALSGRRKYHKHNM